MDVFNTIMLIASRNNLAHIIIFNNGIIPRGNFSVHRPHSAYIQVVDMACSHLARGLNVANRNETGVAPVLNIAIHCPNMSTFGNGKQTRSRNQHDMLIKPFLNIILFVEEPSTISLLKLLRRQRGIQRLLFMGEHNVYGGPNMGIDPLSCWSGIIRDLNGTKVAMVTIECDYRAKSRLLSEQFQGFKGQNIHVITQEAFTLSEKRIEDNATMWTGFAFEVLNFLADVLDFRYTVDVPVDKSYGGGYSNGTGFGMIGMLMNKETDMVTGLITRTPSRMSVVDMPSPIYNDRTILTIYAEESEHWGSFRQPFHELVYPVLLVCMLAVPWALWFVSKYSRSSNQPLQSISEWGLHGLGLFFAKGFPFRIYGIPLRIVLISSCFGLVPLLAMYSGTLVASFTNKKPNLPFEDLEGAVQDNGFVYYIGFGGGSHDYIRHSKNSKIRALLRKLEPVTYDVIKEGYSGGHDYLGIINSEIWKYTITKGNSSCNWYVVNEDIFKVDHSFAMPKNSPYLEVFSNRIQDLIELGFLDKWKRLYLRSDQQCRRGGKSQALPLAHCKALFVILLIGLAVGLFALILEMKAYRPNENQ